MLTAAYSLSLTQTFSRELNGGNRWKLLHAPHAVRWKTHSLAVRPALEMLIFINAPVCLDRGRYSKLGGYPRRDVCPAASDTPRLLYVPTRWLVCNKTFPSGKKKWNRWAPRSRGKNIIGIIWTLFNWTALPGYKQRVGCEISATTSCEGQKEDVL